MTVVLPPSTMAVMSPAVLAEYDKRSRLEEQLQREREELTRLRGELERAELQRATEIRDAALAEKPLPTKDPTKPTREAIDLSTSRIAGFEDAISAQAAIVDEVVERDRAEILATAKKRRAEIAQKYEKAIDVLAAIRAEFVVALENEKYVADFPRSNWNGDAGSLVMAPVSREQRLARWEAVEAALRQDADVERRLKHEPAGSFEPLAHMPVPERDEEGRARYPITSMGQGVPREPEEAA